MEEVKNMDPIDAGTGTVSLDLIPGVGGRELSYEGKMADEVALLGLVVLVLLALTKSS